MASAFSAVQSRIDDGRETLQRPELRVVGSAFQWDEQTNGALRFRLTHPAQVVTDSRPSNPRELTTVGPLRHRQDAASPGTDLFGIEQVKKPVVHIEPPLPAHRRFVALQQWEGTVLDVRGTEFSASLRDLTNARFPEEQATFHIDEISYDDRDLLVPGAVFYWSIGYETSHTGQVSKASKIFLQRLPRWTRSDIARVKTLASTLKGLFGP
jgi:hypothetical protein